MENKYRDYYEGSTFLKYPNYYDYDTASIYCNYKMTTYKTSGSLKTPYYGETFNAKKFEYIVWYEYQIVFPDNILSLAEKYSGLREGFNNNNNK